MNILLNTAIAIAALHGQAQATQQSYTITLEAQAIVNECPASVPCYTIQGQQYATRLHNAYAIGDSFTAKFTMQCDLDENCKVIHIED